MRRAPSLFGVQAASSWKNFPYSVVDRTYSPLDTGPERRDDLGGAVGEENDAASLPEWQ